MVEFKAITWEWYNDCGLPTGAVEEFINPNHVISVSPANGIDGKPRCIIILSDGRYLNCLGSCDEMLAYFRR